jgi:light-regulated signal transduction histidine kinase (bacteriophytochrome)
LISVVLALSMAFCAGLAGVFLARRLTIPVTKLMRTAARITMGETTLQAEVEGPKEIAGLARAFNAMTTRLRQTLEGLEQRVSERTAQLKESVDELEAFSYSVSHDLRAPLRAIHGFSNILMEDFAPGLPAQSVHYLRLIFENTKQMGDLIDGLLAFSRLGRHTLEKKNVAPAELVRQALEVLAEEQKGRRIDISIGELPPCEGDPMLLQQVWINLISNALKFTRRRATAVIAIGYERNNDHPAYYVRDNGIGFDMKYAEKLFGVFQRLHKSEEFEGTGVGLATVYRIIRRHGGRIWADAKPDEGAVFYFAL